MAGADAWFYLTQPEAMISEPFQYMNTLSVTMGTTVHGFIQTCLTHLGVLCTPVKLQALGFEVDPVNGEPAFVDESVGSRGHGDGVLEIFLPAYPEYSHHLLEFKTSSDSTLRQIEDLDLDAFKAKWPSYYAQVQEYLRMTGLQVMVVLFMQMGYPWALKEFHVPLNPRFANDTRDKYRSVRLAVASGEMPMPCCGPRSAQAKVCPARADLSDREGLMSALDRLGALRQGEMFPEPPWVCPRSPPSTPARSWPSTSPWPAPAGS